MSQISVKNINKTFTISKREKGMMNAILGLFHREYMQIKALDNICFEIEEGELVGYRDL